MKPPCEQQAEGKPSEKPPSPPASHPGRGRSSVFGQSRVMASEGLCHRCVPCWGFLPKPSNMQCTAYLEGWAENPMLMPLVHASVSESQMPEPERVRNDRHRTHHHRCAGDHRIEQQATH